MEKYRLFADESVGVHPFIPVACMQAQLTPAVSVISRINSLLLKGARGLTSAVLVPLRCSLLLLAALWLLLLQPLLLLLLPLPYLRWRAALLLQKLPLRLALFALGILRIREQTADFRRLKIRAPSRVDKGHADAAPWSALLSLPSPGGAARGKGGGGKGSSTSSAAEQQQQISKCCICLCSFTCLVEPLYVAYRLSPTFALLHTEGGFSFVSLPQVLLYSLQFELPPGRGRYSNLSQLLAAHAAAASPCIPLVLFPEGQKSNGQCLLAWQQQRETGAESAAGDAAACSGSSSRKREEGKGGSSSSFDEAALRALDGRIAELGCMYNAEESSEEKRKRKGKRVPYGLPHTVYSPAKHLAYALAEWQQPLQAIWATPADVQACLQQQQQAAAGGRGSSGGAASGETLLLLREVMVRMLPGRTPVIKSGADLAPFTKYWERTQRDQYLKAQ